MLDICYYSLELSKKASLPYKSYNCKFCTTEKHVYMYIEYSYQNDIYTKEIKKELKNPNPKVRHAALLLFIKTFGPAKIPSFMHEDPFYKIRKLCIENLNMEEIISYLDDINDEIILRVLEVLYERYCEFKEFYDKHYTTKTRKDNLVIYLDILCKKMTEFMTHPNKQIRIITSKLISIFYKLDFKIFYNLLYKNIENDVSGTVVYGLEDECSLVRKNTIISLYVFYIKVISQLNIQEVKPKKKQKKKKQNKEETRYKELINITVEYFVNTINDEDEEVRNTAILLFNKMTESSKFKLSDDLIMQISYNIINNTIFTDVDFHLMGIFRNIRFKSGEVLIEVIKKLRNKLETKYLINTINEIFNNNLMLVHKKLYSNTIFAEQEQELINKDFVVKILINYILKKHFQVKVSKNIKKYFSYIDILLNKPDRMTLMKENLISLVKEEKYENVFNCKGVYRDPIIFMTMFFKGLIRKNLKGLLRLNDKFNNVNLTKDILFNNAKLVDFIRNINHNITKK